MLKKLFYLTLFLPSLALAGTPYQQVQNPFTGRPDYVTIAGSSSVTISSTNINWGLGSNFTKTLAASSTFTFTNSADGEVISVAVTNTVSNYTLNWPAAVLWTGGTAPTLTTGAHTDIFTFIKFGTSIYGSYLQNY